MLIVKLKQGTRECLLHYSLYSLCTFENVNNNGLPWWAVVKNLLCNTGDTSLIPAWETKLPHPGGN